MSTHKRPNKSNKPAVPKKPTKSKERARSKETKKSSFRPQRTRPSKPTAPTADKAVHKLEGLLEQLGTVTAEVRSAINAGHSAGYSTSPAPSPPASRRLIKPPPGSWYHDVPPPEGSIYSGNGPLTATRKKLATVMTMAENTLVKRSKDGKYYVTQNAFGKGFDIWFRTNNEYEMYKKRL